MAQSIKDEVELILGKAFAAINFQGQYLCSHCHCGIHNIGDRPCSHCEKLVEAGFIWWGANQSLVSQWDQYWEAKRQKEDSESKHHEVLNKSLASYTQMKNQIDELKQKLAVLLQDYVEKNQIHQESVRLKEEQLAQIVVVKETQKVKKENNNKKFADNVAHLQENEDEGKECANSHLEKRNRPLKQSNRSLKPSNRPNAESKSNEDIIYESHSRDTKEAYPIGNMYYGAIESCNALGRWGLIQTNLGVQWRVKFLFSKLTTPELKKEDRHIKKQGCRSHESVAGIRIGDKVKFWTGWRMARTQGQQMHSFEAIRVVSVTPHIWRKCEVCSCGFGASSSVNFRSVKREHGNCRSVPCWHFNHGNCRGGTDCARSHVCEKCGSQEHNLYNHK
eukprot:100441_1